MTQDEANMIERCAYAIFFEFIRGGIGSRRILFDERGDAIGKETLHQAAKRRWDEMPETKRDIASGERQRPR